jgi:hypothetical protein
MQDKVHPENFLPSSRSIAFRKKNWERIEGYPEELDTCEDLVFASRLKKAGFKFKLAQNAIVYWRQRRNLTEAFTQFFSYAKGDGKALYIRPQTPYLFARYLAGLILVILLLITKSNVFMLTVLVLASLYIAWAIIKNYRYVKNRQAILILPVLQISSDVAVICGMSVGVLARLN